MEIWLSYNNGEESILLPVPPPEPELVKTFAISTESVTGVGEVAIAGRQALATIELASFFPAKYYSFSLSKNPAISNTVKFMADGVEVTREERTLNPLDAPLKFVQKIEAWANTLKPIRLKILSLGINMAVLVESFSYYAQAQTGDIYYTLALKEYRFLTAKTAEVAVIDDVAIPNSASLTVRPVTKATTGKKYTVKTGDTLWNICKKELGNGSLYTSVATKNNIKDPNKITVGQVITL